MKTKMTPREALYNICIELGPARTERNDNLTAKEIRLRDSVRILQNFILYHGEVDIPRTADEYLHVDRQSRKLPPLSREDFIE